MHLLRCLFLLASFTLHASLFRSISGTTKRRALRPSRIALSQDAGARLQNPEPRPGSEPRPWTRLSVSLEHQLEGEWKVWSCVCFFLFDVDRNEARSATLWGHRTGKRPPPGPLESIMVKYLCLPCCEYRSHMNAKLSTLLIYQTFMALYLQESQAVLKQQMT